ncbi:manganese efflux pump MntP family protein [Proteinivorax hydrogeniformans]|uniref:Putative manganese efflux pump MntP n=1 Tax=Proteinivorax hydrogeniformans TaxID=1826727 RepID=A0AAU8HTN1_9FIRM
MSKRVVILHLTSKRIMTLTALILLTSMLILSGGEITVFAGGVDSLNWGQLLSLVLIAIALGTDALSLCVGVGMKKLTAKEIIKVSVVIGLFHVFMPLIGLYLGQIFGRMLGEIAQYLGSIIIVLIGANMIYESFKEEDNDEDCTKKLTGISLMILALGVSLDALSVGFSLGTLGFSTTVVVLTFGFFGALMSAIGLMFGKYIGAVIGNHAEKIGGLVLIALGIKMIFF